MRTEKRLRKPRGGEIDVGMDILTITLRLEIGRTGGWSRIQDVVNEVHGEVKHDRPDISPLQQSEPTFLNLQISRVLHRSLNDYRVVLHRIECHDRTP